MLKIPLKSVNMTTFPDHGWRFGIPKAFYITTDDTNAIYKTQSSDDDTFENETEYRVPYATEDATEDDRYFAAATFIEQS